MTRLARIALASAAAGGACFALKAFAEAAEVQRYSGIARGKRILILGSGFGGIAAASELARLLPQEDNGEITLVAEDNFLLFTPMLTEAAGGELDARHIAVGVREFSKRIRFIQGTIRNIDVKSRTVTVSVGPGGLEPAQLTLQADELVVALGSVTNFHHVPGAEEYAISMKRLADAEAIRRRVLASLERALVENNAAQRRSLLSFVVAGGGYTGVETIAAVNDLLRNQAAEYGLRGDEVRTVLVNPGSRLLTETSPALAGYALEKLQQHGVEVLMGASVKSVSPDSVELSTGEQIPCHTLIWAAGVRPSPVVESLECEKGKHGGVKTTRCCEVHGFPGLWALGDCAEIPNESGGTYAPTAQNATREGALVARNIVARLAGEALRPFLYRPVGELALVGRHAGVARLLGFNMHGLIAWALWRAVYLSKIPGADQKFRIAADWTLDLLFGRQPIELGGRAPSQVPANTHAAGLHG